MGVVEIHRSDLEVHFHYDILNPGWTVVTAGPEELPSDNVLKQFCIRITVFAQQTAAKLGGLKQLCIYSQFCG